jgi:hypothetical protein
MVKWVQVYAIRCILINININIIINDYIIFLVILFGNIIEMYPTPSSSHEAFWAACHKTMDEFIL